MPGARSPLQPLPDAVSQAAVEAETIAWKPNEVIQLLLSMTTDFLSLTERDTIFGKGNPSPDPYGPSLGNLYSRLQAGQIPPSPIASHASLEPRGRKTLHRRTSKKLLQRPLADYEDLYYALLALIQEMHTNLTTRIINGFNTLSSPLSEGDHSISHILEYLLGQWYTLNNPSLAKALDDAIRSSRFKRLQKQLSAQWMAGDYTKQDYDELKDDLEDPSSYASVPGLNWIAGWSPAMINAQLMQKYHPVFSMERKEKVKKERWANKKRRMEKTAAEQREKARRMSAERESQRPAQRQQQEMQPQTQPQSLELQMQTRPGVDVRAQRVSNYLHGLRSTASDGARRMMHDIGYNVSQNLYGSGQSPAGYTSPNDQHSFFVDSPIQRSPMHRIVQQSFFIGDQAYDDNGSHDAQQNYYSGGSAQHSYTGYYGGGQNQQGYTSPNAHHSVYEHMPSPERRANRNIGQSFLNGAHPLEHHGNREIRQSPSDGSQHQADHTPHSAQQNLFCNTQPGHQFDRGAQRGLYIGGHSPEVYTSYETQSSSNSGGLIPGAFGNRRQGFYGVGLPQRDTSAYLVQQGFNMDELEQSHGQPEGREDRNGYGDVEMGDDAF